MWMWDDKCKGRDSVTVLVEMGSSVGWIYGQCKAHCSATSGMLGGTDFGN